jgi:hypothetical protein
VVVTYSVLQFILQLRVSNYFQKAPFSQALVHIRHRTSDDLVTTTSTHKLSARSAFVSFISLSTNFRVVWLT